MNILGCDALLCIKNGGVEDTAYNQAVPELQESNRKIVLTFSLLCAAALAAMSVLSFALPALSGYRTVYIGFLAVFSVIHLGAAHFANTKRTIAVLSIIFMISVMLLGILLGTVFSPSETTATFIAFLLCLPQLFTERPYRIWLFIFVSVSVFICMVFLYKDPVTYTSDIVNAILFGCVSAVFSLYSIMNRVSRCCMENTIRHMAETDQLTGLKNRNSYEQKLQSMSVLALDSLYCVYVDVNGLHEINNNQGHEAGDRMLQYVATAMKNIFGQDHTYRIGGDEYVALGIDSTPKEIELLARRLKQAVESGGYHIAIGISHKYKEHIEIIDLIKEAEVEMYKDKANYYRHAGIDRRKAR